LVNREEKRTKGKKSKNAPKKWKGPKTDKTQKKNPEVSAIAGTAVPGKLGPNSTCNVDVGGQGRGEGNA